MLLNGVADQLDDQHRLTHARPTKQTDLAALRVGITLLPEGAKFWAPLILVLATVNVVYGAFIAMVQTDFEYVIGFSSVSHMGLVMLGFATLNRQGLTGAGLQMFSHGVMTALFFAVVGLVYDRAHTREIPKLGGFIKPMPLIKFDILNRRFYYRDWDNLFGN